LPPAVAIVVDLKGTATLRHAQGPPRSVRRGALVYPDDSLEAAEGGSVFLVFLKAGQLEIIPAKAQVTVKEDGCQPANAVTRHENKLMGRNLTALRDLARSGRAGGTVFRSAPSRPPARVVPMEGATVLDDNPDLTWVPGGKAQGYRVEMVTGVEGAREQVLWREMTTGARLPYPKKPPLERGNLYRWRVFALLEGDREREVVQGSFLVASARLVKQLAAIDKLAHSQETADQLLAALTYESFKVYDKALPLYEDLARREPKEVHFQEALAYLYGYAGRPDLAEEAWRRAEALGATRPRKGAGPDSK